MPESNKDALGRRLASGLKGDAYKRALAEYGEESDAARQARISAEKCAVCGRKVGKARLGLLNWLGQVVGWCCSGKCWTSDAAKRLILRREEPLK